MRGNAGLIFPQVTLPEKEGRQVKQQQPDGFRQGRMCEWRRHHLLAHAGHAGPTFLSFRRPSSLHFFTVFTYFMLFRPKACPVPA